MKDQDQDQEQTHLVDGLLLGSLGLLLCHTEVTLDHRGQGGDVGALAHVPVLGGRRLMAGG